MTRALVALMLLVTTGAAEPVVVAQHRTATIAVASSTPKTVVRSAQHRAQRATRSHKRKALAKKVVVDHKLNQLAQKIAQASYLPLVQCWNGDVVVDHPGQHDCPRRPKVKPKAAKKATSLTVPAIWRALVQCEAGGDWQYGGPHGHTDPGYNFEGGPNFVHSTWTSHGGREFAEHAYDASPYDQIVVARRVLADEGVYAWPVCGPRVGLQRGD